MQLPRLLVADLHHGDAQAPEDVKVGPRIAAYVGHGPDDEQGRVDAPLDQGSGHDEAVAAVIAGAAKHSDSPAKLRLVGSLHRGDDLPPGVLHQHKRRNTDLLDGVTIGLAHLCGVENAHQ